MHRTRTSRIGIVAGLLALTIAAAACGSDSPASDPQGSGKTADQKAVEQAIESVADTQNRKDVKAFLALWTDKGLESYDVGSRADLEAGKVESFGEDKIKVVAFPETIVTGDTAVAKVHAANAEHQVAQTIFEVKFTAIKQNGTWLMDGFEFLGSPKPAAGTETIEIKAQEYAFVMDKDSSSGKVAFKLTNTGKEQHEVTLYKTPDGVDLATARKAVENVDGSELKDIPNGYKVDHVGFVEAGQSSDISFGAPLPAGTYLLACYIPQGGFGEQGPVNPDGKPHIQLGMASLLTIK